MKIQNSKLDFLDAFYIASSNEKNASKLDVIVDVRPDRVVFGLFGELLHLLYSVMQPNSDTGVWTYPIQKLYPLLQQFPKDAEIEFTETEIRFSKKQKYSFQKQLAVYDPTDTILQKIAEAPKRSFSFVDLDKLSLTKSFQGSDTNLSVTDLQNNHWVASNKQVVCMFNTKNSLPNEIFHIPKIIIQLAEKLKLQSLEIRQYDEIKPGIPGWILENQGLHILVAEQKYILPNVFTPAIAQNIPTDSLSVDKKELISALNRLAVVSVENLDNRIYISAKGDELYLESREYNICQEIIPIKSKSYTPKGDIEFLIDTQSFIRGINAVPGDIITIKVNSDPSAPMRMIQLENSTQEEKVLHVLLSKKTVATAPTNQQDSNATSAA